MMDQFKVWHRAGRSWLFVQCPELMLKGFDVWEPIKVIA